MFPVREQWRLRQNNMGVCASESERIYANEPFSICFRERFDRRRDAEFQFFEIDMRTRRGEVQARGNLTVLEDQHRFHKSRDTGGCLEMTQICLNRTDRERSGTILAQSLC